MTTNTETASKEGISKTILPLFLGRKEEGVRTMEQSPAIDSVQSSDQAIYDAAVDELRKMSRAVQSIKWRTELSIDQGIIDADHRYVIATINRFQEKIGSFKKSDDALEILKDVRFYIEKHFAREEKLLRAARFPFLDAQQHEHSYLIKTIDDAIAEIKPIGFGQKWQAKKGETDINTAGEQFGQFVGDWFINHVIKTDFRMKPYVAKMKDRAATMEKLETYRRK